MAINRYDAWGIPQFTNVGRFGYTGQTWMPELGLWNYKARFYSSVLGRFLQTDPIGYDAGLNLYNYVDSDPINAIDPMGLEDILVTAKKPIDVSINNIPSLVARINIGSIYPGYSKVDGNFGYLPVINHESLYNHYNYGKGARVVLTPGQFRNIASKAKLGSARTKRLISGLGEYSQQIRLYGTIYGYMFGTATGIFDPNGRMIGFYDNFNLDPKDFFVDRSLPAEVVTRGGYWLSKIMTLGGAEPFDVIYPGN